MNKLTPPVDSRDHILGKKQAPVTLVEYGDYECPYCGEASKIVKDLIDEMGDQLLYVFRNYPLGEIHPNAQHAALASEAAGAQGKFWEMHALLFENQDHLEVEDLVDYASQLGLDVPRFVRDLEEGHQRDKVNSDIQSGNQSGVDSTPSFFVNGFKYEGEWNFEALLSLIERVAERSRMKKGA